MKVMFRFHFAHTHTQGVISVCFEKQENGEIKPLAYPKKGLIIKTAPPPLVPNSHDLRLSLKCTQNVHQEPNVGISFKMGKISLTYFMLIDSVNN